MARSRSQSDVDTRPIATPASFISDILDEIDPDPRTAARARQLAEDISMEAWTSGWSRVGLAAGCIYVARLVTQEDLTQAEIADAAGISEVTVRGAYRRILDHTRWDL